LDNPAGPDSGAQMVTPPVVDARPGIAIAIGLLLTVAGFAFLRVAVDYLAGQMSMFETWMWVGVFFAAAASVVAGVWTAKQWAEKNFKKESLEEFLED
jgi:cbb3-type cytochrome oxidase subunit 1